MSRFVHILVFACPQCRLPIAVSRLSPKKTFDEFDGQRFCATCEFCAKVFDVQAHTAKRHLVESWDE